MAGRTWACGWVLLLLAACGGGGGGGSTPPPPPPPTVVGASCTASTLARWDSEPLQAGRSAELHVLSCGEPLDMLLWTQTEGPPLQLLSARSPSLSFTPPAPGRYGFALRFRDARGNLQQASLALTAAAADPDPALLLTRGEPSAWSGHSLSLRAWPQGLSSAALLGATTQWERLSGPALELSNPSASALIFKAPEVVQDELLVLRARLQLADGRRFEDQFRLLVQAPPGKAAKPLFGSSNPPSRVYPYLENGPQAAALARCVYSPALSADPNNLCTLGELPLLGQAGPSPTVEQVMERLLVSHDWMGQVFERFLREQDPQGDFRRLLASSTAVVIGARVRPSFYWSATGAIYIDGAYLWMTPEQRDTLSEAADPRAGYGPLLQYSMPWRYVKDNDYTAPARPVTARGSRGLEELRYALARLLYHELAHAGDFLPPRVHASLDPSRRVYEGVPAATASEQLQQRLPFYSQVMVELGRVLFFGLTATAQQNAYLPQDIVGFFSTDRVTSDYSYSLAPGQSVPREDAAMLVEEALMQLRYGVLRDVAVTPRVPDGQSAADTPVVWGQRGRIGEAAIRPRLALVLAEIMPWVSAEEQARLAAPIALRAGRTWGQNLNPANPAPPSSEQRARELELARERAQPRAIH